MSSPQLNNDLVGSDPEVSAQGDPSNMSLQGSSTQTPLLGEVQINNSNGRIQVSGNDLLLQPFLAINILHPLQVFIKNVGLFSAKS